MSTTGTQPHRSVMGIGVAEFRVDIVSILSPEIEIGHKRAVNSG